MYASFFLFFVSFPSRHLVSLSNPSPRISIAGSVACNCLRSPVILLVTEPTTDEQLKVASLTLEDSQSRPGISSFLFGLADHNHTLRQPL
jgi:hypothetical protein